MRKRGSRQPGISQILHDDQPTSKDMASGYDMTLYGTRVDVWKLKERK